MKHIRHIKDSLYYYTGITCLFFITFASFCSPAANTIGSYLAIPPACVITTLFNKGSHINIYEKLLYGLFVWDCIAYLWVDNKELASTELHMVLGASLLAYCISIFARKLRFIPCLYFVYVLLYLSAWNYTVRDIFTMMVDGSDRLNDEVPGASTMAYYIFHVTFLLFMLWQITKNRRTKRLQTIFFWLMLPVSFGVLLLIASRQIIIIQVPLYGALLYECYIRGVRLKKKIQPSLVAVLVIVALSGQTLSICKNSFLKQRAGTDARKDSKMMLIYDTTKVALRNMPLEVGGDNYQGISRFRQISHNSYLEAFVNLSSTGSALYIAFMAVFTLRRWRRYETHHHKVHFYLSTFGVIYFFYDVFFVFYNVIWLISSFILVAAHNEIYYAEHHKELDRDNREELSTYCGTE